MAYFEGTVTFNSGEAVGMLPSDIGDLTVGETYTVTLGAQKYECYCSDGWSDYRTLGSSQYVDFGSWDGIYPFVITTLWTSKGVILSIYLQDTTITSLYVKIQLASEVPVEPDPEPEPEPEPVAPPTDYVTDRTEGDVGRWKYLRDKGWPNMTTAEQNEWLGYMKGRYSHVDLNRVETAVQRIASLMVKMGYLAATPSVKTDWSADAIPTNAAMQRYLGNIRTLRNAISVYPDTPAAPDVSQRMSYTVANDIEKILMDIEYILTTTTNGWFYVGDLYSGEV